MLQGLALATGLQIPRLAKGINHDQPINVSKYSSTLPKISFLFFAVTSIDFQFSKCPPNNAIAFG